MVNKKVPTDTGTRMNLDSGQETIDVGNKSGREAAAMLPEKMGQAVGPQGVQSRIAKDDLKHIPCCRVFIKDCPDVFSKRPEKHLYPPLLACLTVSQSFPALYVRCSL